MSRNKFALSTIGALLTMLHGAVTAAEPNPECLVREAAEPAVTRLQAVMATGRFVAYQPTSLQVINGALTQADTASIKEDLQTLRPHFDGLITYGSANGAERIADLAASLGYRAVILGIWDIKNQQEIDAAVAAAKRQPQLVVGISLGNERLFAKEATALQLAQGIEKLRKQAPQLALTTTEPFHLFLDTDAGYILRASDFMLVNVHPIFEPWYREAPDANAADFVVKVTAKLGAVACGPVLLKETGVPTAPQASGFTPERQAGFYQVLRQRFKPSADAAFAYFSAFDAPWRVNDVSPVPGEHPEEAYFGLFDEQRKPKPVMQKIPVLKPAP